MQIGLFSSTRVYLYSLPQMIRGSFPAQKTIQHVALLALRNLAMAFFSIHFPTSSKLLVISLLTGSLLQCYRLIQTEITDVDSNDEEIMKLKAIKSIFSFAVNNFCLSATHFYITDVSLITALSIVGLAVSMLGLRCISKDYKSAKDLSYYNKINHAIQEDIAYFPNRQIQSIREKEMEKRILKKDYDRVRLRFLTSAAVDLIENKVDLADSSAFAKMCQLSIFYELDSHSPVSLADCPPTLLKHLSEIKKQQETFNRLGKTQKQFLKADIIQDKESKDFQNLINSIKGMAYPLLTRCSSLFPKAIQAAEMKYAWKTLDLLKLLKRTHSCKP